MDRNVSIIEDVNGNKIAIVNDIIFKGKRNVNWNEVKDYLKSYVNEFYEIADTKDVVYIGNDFPNEFTGEMRNLDGIGMIQGLRFRFMMKMGK